MELHVVANQSAVGLEGLGAVRTTKAVIIKGKLCLLVLAGVLTLSLLGEGIQLLLNFAQLSVHPLAAFRVRVRVRV